MTTNESMRRWRQTVLPAILLLATSVFGQERTPGTAIVQAGDGEYTIPIDCYVPLQPELGFSTEPARITREATGRSSGVRLTVRPWKETTYLVISLDRYVAWVPSQSSSAGALSMTLDMSPASSVIDGIPTALTFDEWMAGNRPAGLEGVTFKADCSHRDPEAPSYRKTP